ncbi:MAG: hydroxysqualene dehydroxylase HpnE [Gemmatimonadetes bacterium]|nr:hydroxysqualene dehydroxylase HpnE [Gemmatimonadota bacterium]
MKRVTIIGGGFAGLAAAVRLCDAGYSVTLLERRQQLGGRTFSFTDPVTGDTVDNGQHLLMKCYRETLDFLDRIGARDNVVFQPRFRIDFRHADGGAYTLRFPSFLPVPLNLLSGFLRFGAVHWTDIPPLRKVVAELHKDLDTGLTVDAWLDDCGQKPRMREAFWDPLCIAALNQRPQNASARYLQAVLREAFLGESDGARLGYARTGLSGLFENRAWEYISKRDGEVLCGKAVTSIVPASSGVRIHTRSGDVIDTDMCIAAVPPLQLARMICGKTFAELYHTLCQYEPSPIFSVNLWFDRSIMREPMCGLLGTTMEWVFNKSVLYGNYDRASEGFLTMVASAAHHLLHMSNEDLVDLSCRELHQVFPESRRAELLHAKVICEHAATCALPLSYCVPKTQTSHLRLFLAGDWTDTGLPPTIEGAVRSGYAAADAILLE